MELETWRSPFLRDACQPGMRAKEFVLDFFTFRAGVCLGWCDVSILTLPDCRKSSSFHSQARSMVRAGAVPLDGESALWAETWQQSITHTDRAATGRSEAG